MLNDTPIEKLKSLWKDDRKLKEKLPLLAISLFSLCFTVLFFGPVEIIALSENSFLFSLPNVFWQIVAFSAIVYVTFLALLSIIRGKLFDFTVCLVFGVMLGCYVQGMVLNTRMGQLTGDAVNWQSQKLDLFFNTGIWIVIMLIPFLIYYFKKSFWKNFILAVSAIIFLMQCTGFVSIIANGALEDKGSKYLTTNGLMEMSDHNNVLVFVLDRMDYEYIEEILQADKQFFTPLDGFTSYTNATSEFARTIPALNYMLSGNSETVYKEPVEKYFESSWSKNNVLKMLSNNDYENGIYTTVDNLFSYTDAADKYVANLSTNALGLNVPAAIKGLEGLSAYRYLPWAFKPFFWSFTDEINTNAISSDVNNYKLDEHAYSQKIDSYELNDKKAFKLIHFNGSHSPTVIQSDGSYIPGVNTTPLEQTMGDFCILYKAFDELKRLGIYDKTAIIITADHGIAVSDSEPLSKATTIGLFYKPANAINKPFTTSNAPVSLKNIPATIAKNANIEYSELGIPLDEVPDDNTVQRYMFKSVIGSSKKEEKLYTYEVPYESDDFSKWKIIKEEKINYSFW